MKCLNKIIIGFGIFSPVLLSVLFVSPSYAIDDITYTFNSSTADGGWQTLCTSSCSNFNYLYVTFSDLDISSNINTSSANFTLQFYLVFNNLGNGSRLYCQPYSVSSCLYSIQPNSSEIGFYRNSLNSTYYGSNWSYTVTLSESNPISSSCPEPEPCPAVPENPYDEKLDNITRAIYTCGAILLVLYFFYCIYRMIIKNSGVNNL